MTTPLTKLIEEGKTKQMRHTMDKQIDAGQVEAVAEWPNNIVADRHDTTGKWVLHYLTDEQAAKCKTALQASGADHIAGLVGALEHGLEAVKKYPEHPMTASEVIFKHALKALPPELRGK